MTDRPSTTAAYFETMREGERACATCKWWTQIERTQFPHAEYQIGWCHGVPPAVHSRLYDSKWPSTRHDDWCGQHTPRAKAQGQQTELRPEERIK